MARSRVSRSTIYELITKRPFTNLVNLRTRSVGWIEGEINEWIAGRATANRIRRARSILISHSYRRRLAIPGVLPSSRIAACFRRMVLVTNCRLCCEICHWRCPLTSRARSLHSLRSRVGPGRLKSVRPYGLCNFTRLAMVPPEHKERTMKNITTEKTGAARRHKMVPKRDPTIAPPYSSGHHESGGVNP